VRKTQEGGLELCWLFLLSELIDAEQFQQRFGTFKLLWVSFNSSSLHSFI